jgi:hypothetical protein
MPSPTFDHVPGMKRARKLPEVGAAGLTQASFFANFVTQSRPVLIKDAVAHWPARVKWRDPDYLKRQSGHHPIYYYPHENYASLRRQARDEVMLPLAEALDRLRAPETEIGFCCTATPVEVMGDLPGFNFVEKVQPAFFYPNIRYFLFRNAGTTWHYHPFDETLMCQVIGAKEVGLVSLDNPHHLQLRDIFFREDYYEDPSVFVSLADGEIDWFMTRVEEGDALYIPPLWWHGVVPVTREFGITAAVPWSSPPPVVAQDIRKMAAGRADIIGRDTAVHRKELFQLAEMMGLQKELALAWERGN